MGLSKKRAARKKNPPRLEALEGRVVPATYKPTSVAQLAADIALVNNSSGPNTIILRPITYELTQELTIQNASNLTIEGSVGNKRNTSVTGPANGRIFDINNSSVTVQNISLSGGGTVSMGGGILAQNSNVTLQKVALTGNSTTQAGGGIAVMGGSLDVENSTITSNVVGSTGDCFGGGIAAYNARVTVSQSSVSNNSVAGITQNPQASAYDSGGGIYTEGGTLTISNTRIQGNTLTAATTGTNAVANGGGVGSVNTPVSVTSSVVSGNSISTVASQVTRLQGGAFSTVGGSLNLRASTVGANIPSAPGEFFHPGATVVITQSTIDQKTVTGPITLAVQQDKPGS